MHKYSSSQKLWRIVKDVNGYYYEIKLAGTVVDRVRVEHPAIAVFKKEGLI